MAYSPQQQKVIAHIERWGSINSIEAIRYYGITRLAARIHELKGTDMAMRGVLNDTVAKPFVTYIPDFEQRRANIKARQIAELSRTGGEEIAGVNIKYTAKFAALNVAEREYRNGN